MEDFILHNTYVYVTVSHSAQLAGRFCIYRADMIIITTEVFFSC
jgi:hypothetical protein